MKTFLPNQNFTRNLLLGLVFLFLGALQVHAQDYLELNPSTACEPADPNANCTANSADVIGAYIGLYDGTKITDANIGTLPDGDAYVFIKVNRNGKKYDLFAQFELVVYKNDGTKESTFIQAFAAGEIPLGTSVHRIYQPIPNYIVGGEISSLVGIENTVVGWDNNNDGMPTCIVGNYSACNAQIPDIIAQGPFIVVPSSDPINCNGETTSVEFLVSGGTSPYSVTFNGSTVNTNSTAIFNNVYAGSLDWTASDSDGHSDGGTLNLGEPDAISAGYSVTTPISCSGGTATIDIDGNGGTPPLEYTLTSDGTSNNTGIFSGVPVGDGQTYTIIDANGCYFEGTFDIAPGDGEAPTGTAPDGTTGINACYIDEFTPPAGTPAFDAIAVASNYSDPGGVTAELTNTSITGTNCSWEVTYTFRVFDNCSNELTNQKIVHSGYDQDPATGTTPSGVANINACANETEIDGLYPTADDEAAIEAAYTDDCGTVTATFVSQTLTGGQCDWTLVRTYNISDGCAGNDFTVTMTYSGSDQDPATGTTPSGVADINACANETEIDGLYPTADDEAAIEAAYTDDCGTVTATFVSQTLTGGQCEWTLVRTYNISDGCADNDFTVTMTYSGHDQDPANGTTPAGVANINACANETEIDGLYPTADDEAAIEAAYTDDCGTVTASFVSQTLTGGQCEWTLVRTYNISDGCADNDFTVTMTYSGYDQDPANGTTPAGVANINACANETEIDGLYPTADDEAAIEAAYTDDCGTVTASFVSQTLTGGQCEWTLVRTYNISDGCADNDFTVTMTYSGYDQDPATGTTPSGVANINACANETEIDGLYPTADDEAAIEAAYTDDCGTVTASFVSQTLTGGQCEWTLVRTYNISDGCAGNDFTVTMTYSGSDQDPATGTTPAGVANINACANETEIDGLYPTADDEAAIEAAYTDDCGTVTASFVSQTLTGGQCEWTLVRTYNISDGCADNDFTVTMTYSGYDQDPATGTTPAGVANINACANETEIDGLYPTADDEAAIEAAYTDGCGTVTASFVSQTLTGGQCEWTLVRTYNISDGCADNDFTVTMTYSGYDQDPPSLITSATIPIGKTDIIGCISDLPTGPTEYKIAELFNDDCGEVTVTKTGGLGDEDTDCNWSVTYNYTIQDNCENFAEEINITYAGGDNVPPVIDNTNLTNINIECGIDPASKLSDWLANHAGATETDNCGGVIWSHNYGEDENVQCDGGAITVIFTATDACGNESTTSASYSIQDNTAPTFNETLPLAEITAECDDVAEAVVLTAADNCDSDVPVEFTETRTDGNCANSYTLTRVWTATDDCGNKTSFTQIVTVSDNTAPAFNETLPTAEITAECDDVAEAVVLTAADNCDSDVPVEFTETRTDGNCANSYTLTRVWTATDDCGNKTSFTQIVTVSDNTAPAFNETLPTAEITAECDDVAEAVVLTATDNCDSDVPVEFTETRTDGNCANSYTLTRTWTATDDCGNETSFTQTVTVSDNTAPTFNETLPTAEITAECDDVAEAVVLTAADNCDSDVPVEFTETRTDGNCENSYTLTRTWTATDDCGNETSFTQTVTVSDNTAPAFNETLPTAEITAECDDVAEAVVLTATDNCDSDVPVEFTETRTDGNCANSYTLTRVWTATDDCGNKTSFTQIVTVSDNTAPAFNETLPTAEITAECDDVAEAVVLTATDNCDSDVPVEFTETRTDGNCANSYTLTRTWTATDDCGNETSFTQTVTVSDNTAPTFNETLPTAEITAECDDVAEAVVLTAADNCDSDVPVEFTETRTDGNCENSYTLTRTWTATDDCGNETSFTQTVTVSDNTAPTFNETLPTAEVTTECDDVAEAVVLTATDNCDSDVPVVFVETRTDGNCANSYTLTRTWTAADDCGNETSFTQTVIVSDNTAPEVTCNDITVQLDANGVATITVDDINGGATDNCGTIATMFISQETFNCDNVGENQVTLTAIDECGNEATCTATVTVEEGNADCGFDPFKANDDILTLIYCPGETVSGDLDLFANDEGFTRENVSFTILTDLPNGVSATDGNLLYVNEQPTEAVITFTYSVCHTVNTENCDTAEVTIVVLLDTDCDGVPNNDDIDDDDDGILDIIEEENALDQTSLDSDGDGIVDRLDIDSDNDGIVDNIEWQSTIAEDGEYDYILPLGIDSNGDGWDDAYDPTSNGITYEPWDMDLDGTPDYLDTDTDSEGEDDNVEGWDEFPNDSIADVSFIGSDADGDGLDDAYDTYNTTTEGWTRGQNAIGSNAYLQDTDADGVRDWRDAVDDRTPPEQFACGEPVIPNAFSPNQDGYNDYFKVMIYCTGDQGGSEERVLGDDFNDARIEIFNRWGNLVYEQERYGNESYWGDVDAWWDGSSMHDMQLGNNQLPTATYYYILYFNDGSREPITGFVFLNN